MFTKNVVDGEKKSVEKEKGRKNDRMGKFMRGEGGGTMIHLNKTIDDLISNGTVEHIAVRVGKRDDVICDVFRSDVCETTLFDMASVTKIMVTTSLALIALDKGLLQLNDTVDKFYTTDKSLSVKNLLTHTMGIGHKPLNKEGNTYENTCSRGCNGRKRNR